MQLNDPFFASLWLPANPMVLGIFEVFGIHLGKMGGIWRLTMQLV